MRCLRLFLALAGFIFCVPGRSNPQQVTDIIEDFESVVPAEANGFVLRHGSFDLPYFSGSGWQGGWAIQRQSLIEFPVIEPMASKLIMRVCPVALPEMTVQGLVIVLNGQRVGRHEFPYDLYRPEVNNGFFRETTIEVDIGAETLLWGKNTLSLEWDYVDNPSRYVSQNTIRHNAAAFVPYLAFRPKTAKGFFFPSNPSRLVAKDTLASGRETKQAIRQPAPSDIHYYAKVSAESELTYSFQLDQRIINSAVEPVEVAIYLSQGTGKKKRIFSARLTPGERESSSGAVDLKNWLGNSEEEIIRISFSARNVDQNLKEIQSNILWTVLRLGRPESREKPLRRRTPTQSEYSFGERRPNVVIYLIDTLRQDCIGPFGADSARTPNFDALAQDGVCFDRLISVSSWTLPSVATLLTGQDPYVHEMIYRRDKETGKTQRLSSNLVTLHEALKAFGYRTILYSANGLIRPEMGFDQGVDEYAVRSPATPLVPEARFLEWLKEYKGAEPFFAYIHNFDPHSPYDKRDEFYMGAADLESSANLDGTQKILNKLRLGQIPYTETDVRYLKALYKSEVGLSDFRLGKILEALKEKDVYNDTLLIVLADHGEEFEDHGSWQHGHTLYQEQILVPLLIKFPENRFAGLRCKDLVSTLDLYPTVLDALGIAPPVPLPGQSLLPLLTEDPSKGLTRQCYASLRFNQRNWSLVTDGRWSLMLRGKAVFGLYDLEHDPGEIRNLFLQRPCLAGYLKQQVLSWQRSQVQLRDEILQGYTEMTDFDQEMVDRLRDLGYLY